MLPTNFSFCFLFPVFFFFFVGWEKAQLIFYNLHFVAIEASLISVLSPQYGVARTRARANNISNINCLLMDTYIF